MKPKTITQLKKKLWDKVSLYVRTKDRDWKDEVSCVTCGKVYHYKKMQAGHFIPGRKGKTLFDTRGIHPQCYRCNINLKGNWARYYEFMKVTYGQKLIDELIKQDKEVFHYTTEWLKEEIKKYE
jgi:5-methylcytosine-specific restriction endonuclease McrA